jgi:hypothetical protein
MDDDETADLAPVETDLTAAERVPFPDAGEPGTLYEVTGEDRYVFIPETGEVVEFVYQGERPGFTRVYRAEQIDLEEEEGDLPINWMRLIWWAIGVTVIVLCVVVAALIVHIIHQVHAATATASTHNAGGVLEILVVAALIIAVVTGIRRFFSGRDD